MLFNSFVFVGFFGAFYLGHLALRGQLRWQNRWLLAASYLFYGYWDLRFLALLVGSTGVDYLIGRALGATEAPRQRKRLLLVSLCANLGVLGFFKYWNFFEASFVALLRSLGMRASGFELEVVLPVGVSFYTFQSLSYTIDVYRKRIAPIRDPEVFALFVAFFPQLMAGPIERATTLIPQVMGPRRIQLSQVDAGLCLILWGYFKKTVIADNVAGVADRVFNGYTQYQGLDLVQHFSGDLLVLTKLRLPVRVLVYSALLLAIALFAVREKTEFIYFQF